MGRIAGVTPEETRQRLLDAAAQVFELKGYEGATVAQIAHEAGVTSGAIYAHYQSKAELLVDALRAHSERAAGELLQAPDTPTDAAGVLVTLAERLRTRGVDRSGLLVEALLASRRDPELAEVLAVTIGQREQNMARLLAVGQERGELTTEVTPDAAAHFALMLGLGSVFVRALGLPPPAADDWSGFVRRLVGAFADDDTP